uniref:Uncharacterized protein n=1 Tax=Ciona intestinalis TaxID=7719 RepID=H2XR18_CIOIN
MWESFVGACSGVSTIVSVSNSLLHICLLVMWGTLGSL